MKSSFYMFIALSSFIFNVNAGWFSSKEGKTFETRGSAVVYTSGSFTVGVEQKNISIPSYIDVKSSTQWNGITHDSESGWTKCRVPLKGKMSWQGVKDRSLVFDCRPLTYFN
jgi:hypothetical protein